MAQCMFFVCDHCKRKIESWDEGNPYYRDEQGKKRYAYHPHHEDLEHCIGNDVPHMCLACGAVGNVDSLKPRTTCRKCKSGPLLETWHLEGRACPTCRQGSFRGEFGAIS